MTVTMNSLSNPSFRSHLYALAAIARRDWLEFWRYPLNAVSHVLQPMVWLREGIRLRGLYGDE
jgi:hypothetical protein